MSSNYQSTRTLFLKTLDKMKSDLEDYKQHDAAKPRYIEKQNSIIAVMNKFLNAVDDALSDMNTAEDSRFKEIKYLYDSIEALVLVCDMAHVEPLLVTHALSSHCGRNHTEQNHECHCYACPDERHNFYRDIYKRNGGGGIGLYRMEHDNRMFFQNIGIPYPA